MTPPTAPARHKIRSQGDRWRARLGRLSALTTALGRALSDDRERRSPPHE